MGVGVNNTPMAKLNIEKTWKSLVALSAEALRMDDKEKAAFAESQVAKLVGLLPYLAGCEEAERTALAHLAVWVVANRGGAAKVFDHKPADDHDPLERLAPIADFRGGDRKVINEGMRRLALCMLAGYKRDMAKDEKSGGYNPLNAKAWDYKKMAAHLAAPAGGALLMAKAAGPMIGDASGIDGVLDSDSAVKAIWQPKAVE